MRKTMMIAAVLIAGMLLWTGVALAEDAPTAQTVSLSSMTPPQLEAQGDQLRKERNYVEAIRYYNAALKKDPKNTMLWNKVGVLQLRTSHYREAEGAFLKALKYDGKNSHALNNLGVIAYSQKNYGKAAKFYKKALAIQEANATYHCNLGTAWFMQDKLDRAMAEYARAVELDPEVFLKTSQAGSVARIATAEDKAKYEFMLARLFAQRGDLDNCLHWLQLAKEDGYNVKDVYKEKDFANVRQDPRLTQIVPPPASTGY